MTGWAGSRFVQLQCLRENSVDRKPRSGKAPRWGSARIAQDGVRARTGGQGRNPGYRPVSNREPRRGEGNHPPELRPSNSFVGCSSRTSGLFLQFATRTCASWRHAQQRKTAIRATHWSPSPALSGVRGSPRFRSRDLHRPLIHHNGLGDPVVDAAPVARREVLEKSQSGFEH